MTPVIPESSKSQPTGVKVERSPPMRMEYNEYQSRGYDVNELRDKHRVPANLHGLNRVTFELDRLESELDVERH